MDLSAASTPANSAGTAVFAVELGSLAASESIRHSGSCLCGPPAQSAQAGKLARCVQFGKPEELATCETAGQPLLDMVVQSRFDERGEFFYLARFVVRLCSRGGIVSHFKPRILEHVGREIMFHAKMRRLTVACCVAAAVLMSAQMSLAQCGCASSAPITYSASYAPAYAAPSTVGYVGPNTQYMPTVVYRALYQPAVTTAYRPVIGYNTYRGYPVTTYRPWLGWNYPARLVPYTTYQPVYSSAVPVVSYMGYNSYPSYSACDSCSPCGGSACSSGSCGTVTYGAPASSCSSCAAPATTVTPAPYTGNGETAPSLNSAPQKTFEEKTQKPVAEPDLKPIPQTDGKLNSMPTPSLPDPSNRTASRSDYSAARVQLTSATIEVAPVLGNDGWQPAKD
jgi:hypothetical protein